MKVIEILKRQNEDKFLKIQYASRFYFNLAEKYDNWLCVILLLTSFCIFMPESWNPCFVKIFPMLLNAFSFILDKLKSIHVKDAALLRNYYDARVLDINPNSFSESDEWKVLDKTETIFSKHEEQGLVQMRNTGYDKPRGVRNWYDIPKSLDGTKAQFECQKSNENWDKKLNKSRLLKLYVIIFLVVIVFFILYILKYNILDLIICFSGLIINMTGRLYDIYQYNDKSRKISNAIEAYGGNPSKENIEYLQKLINERREIKVLGVNFYHKRVAPKLSKHFHNILINKYDC